MKAIRKPGSLLALAIIILGVQFFAAAPRAWAASPMENIKGLIQEIQTIMQTENGKAQRLCLIEKATAKCLDFREMAKRCLGATWSNLSGAQKNEFVQLFSQLLKASYAHHLDEFVKAKVNYLGEIQDGDGSEVRIMVLRANDRIPVNFRLLNKPGGWMVYDLNIEGVSMVSNYRSQFERAIRAISYQGLVGRLKSKLKEENLG